ncbi:hypothetical protein C8R43DRAFT_876433 [Mycena crocata]|nr:hypothetical protein C8R43DRAFT_876433 [Mycena crocata]
MKSFLRLTILVSALFSAAAEPSWLTRNRETIQKIYNLTVYPANAKIITGGAEAVPPGLFNANATGRVTPVGSFTGFQDSIEYFFGLAPLPSGIPPNGVFTDATLAEFTSGCAEVAASTVYLTASTINPNGSVGAFISILKEIAFWHFDQDGAVLYYDAWIPTPDPFSIKLGWFDFSSTAATNATIQHVCGLQNETCIGNTTVYDSVDDCVQTLTAKRFGRLDETWGDNVVCRSIHALLTKFRPEIHCPHVGPTGGGKCIDVDYNAAYLDDELVFDSPLGRPFHCKNDIGDSQTH